MIPFWIRSTGTSDVPELVPGFRLPAAFLFAAMVLAVYPTGGRLEPSSSAAASAAITRRPRRAPRGRSQRRRAAPPEAARRRPPLVCTRASSDERPKAATAPGAPSGRTNGRQLWPLVCTCGALGAPRSVGQAPASSWRRSGRFMAETRRFVLSTGRLMAKTGQFVAASSSSCRAFASLARPAEWGDHGGRPKATPP